jgi:heat shock protein HtpX
MAMNFWEAQRRAKSRTTLYVMIFVFFTLFVASGAEFVLRNISETNYNPTVPWVGLIFIAVTFCVAGYQYSCFQLAGGKYLAEALGAELVDSKTTNIKKIQLLNIVQEIAIASSLPVPPVYILEVNDINAFAAGLGEKNAIITVTRGCLNLLSRDELQGVIAHEFGHIYNGDMKISMRLAAMVMGFYIVFVLALRLLQYGPNEREDDRKGPNVYMIALVMMVAGLITYLFGSILKASVSREREYLADACAVQFTRNPNGIANALRKIASTTVSSDMPKEGLAFSHIYFDDRSGLSSLFATHPPIEKRIAMIEGLEYLPEEWKKDLKLKKE